MVWVGWLVWCLGVDCCFPSLIMLFGWCCRLVIVCFDWFAVLVFVGLLLYLLWALVFGVVFGLVVSVNLVVVGVDEFVCLGLCSGCAFALLWVCSFSLWLWWVCLWVLLV